jgi:hypothetical protein
MIAANQPAAIPTTADEVAVRSSTELREKSEPADDMNEKV